jgi:aspartyl-tRNA(Asn)/glutamyl-tRNA(Gln) amidotransferase subunit A
MSSLLLSATGIASAIHMREVRAREVVAMAIERISTGNNALNCFTTVLADRAMADADAVDKAIAGGYDPGPLAGVCAAAIKMRGRRQSG